MNSQSPFGSLDFSEKQMVYLGLLSLVKSNSGVGFANRDQGHPAYVVGRNGTHDYAQWGDSPERNTLFKMMHSLSVELSEAEIDGSSEISEYVFSWADFCALAYEAYLEAKGST
jgi:hypothetical protein